MKAFTTKRRATQAGYSLVEVTLALLVVAVGLTATFALFPEGLKATRAAVDDTEIAMFAEYVFTTLDLTAGKYGGNFGANPGWDIADTDDFISLMLSTYTASSNFEIRVTSGNNVETLRWMPDFYGINVPTAVSDFSYEYFRDPAAPFQTSAFTYSLTLAVSTWKGYGSGATTYAVLKVWPGETKGPDSAARIFYREILPIR